MVSSSRRESPAPTVKDVAVLAGVSPMPAPRVVSGVPTVNDQLRDRVLAAIDTLGYEPNRAAAAMRNASSGGMAVGLCVETIENPFSAAVARGIELALRPHGGLLFTASSEGDPETERDILLEFYRRRVAGLVVMTVSPNHDFLVPHVHPRLPVVYLDRPALLAGCDHVTADHMDGSDACASHLIAHGHRRIGFIGTNLTGHPVAERFAGYRAALERAGIPLDESLVVPLEHDRSTRQAREAIDRLLDAPHAPTALFAASNSDMMVVTQTLHQRGVAGRIAHIAFDDIAFDDIAVADLITPPLSVYSQDPVELGRLSGEAILRRRAEPRRQVANTTVLQGRLIPRGSGEIPPSPSPTATA
ncbi:MAG TPA: LacI family DNA-binding transcriptional regulator [Arachnia sp.]|nr:LacI family DNA-binding transcriptional regulator [Arachnia sp.]